MDAATRQQTFDRWLADYRGLVFKVTRAYAANLVDQDDLFQEIAVALWKSLEHFRGESAETTWVYRVSLYTAISWLRTRTRHRTQPLDEAEHVLTTTERPSDDRLDWLYARIRELNEIDRSVTLLMLEGLSYHQIAETLGITENHVAVKVHRVKKRLAAGAAEEDRNELR